MNPNSTKAFFALARERYAIFLKKAQGLPPPWTEDPILQQFRFCNVFREDDKVTRYIRQTYPPTVFAMCLARYLNRISSLRIVDELHLLQDEQFPWTVFRVRMSDEKHIFGAAYIIASPPGMNKLDGIIEILRPIEEQQGSITNRIMGGTLQHAHEVISSFPYVGKFMAYEIVSDLRHTPILSSAPDIDTWCHLGPGAWVGLCRMLDVWVREKYDPMPHMQHLLEYSRNPAYWPQNWPRWEMREVEHVLCEFDKYERTRLGEGVPKQRYPGGF